MGVGLCWSVDVCCRGGNAAYGGSRYSRFDKVEEEKEDEIFKEGNSQGMGINFDKYDDIPVEVEGVDCPL